MKKRLVIASLHTVSPVEATSYLEAAEGDELGAAVLLATDRNALDGSPGRPDEAEVHHALLLLRRALGVEQAPSFDSLRIQLKKRKAA